MTSDVHIDAGGVSVRISNPDKIVFPDSGWTKLDVANHFTMCGEGALRNVYNRPTMLKRWSALEPHVIGCGHAAAKTGYRLKVCFLVYFTMPFGQARDKVFLMKLLGRV